MLQENQANEKKEKITGNQCEKDLLLNNDESKHNFLSSANMALFVQYFAVGICYQLSMQINYEFFRSYLGQNGEMYNIAIAMTMLPWNLKVIFATLNDTVPIYKKRRKPYIMIGWSMCSFVAFCMSTLELPLPRNSIQLCPNCSITNFGNLTSKQCKEMFLHKIPDPHLSDKDYVVISVKYLLMLMCFITFLVMTDVALDGLMVQYARKEKIEERGRVQTAIYSCRNLGFFVAALIRGFGLNWYLYVGPWCHGLDMDDIFFILAICSLVSLGLTIVFTHEDDIIEMYYFKKSIFKMWNTLCKVGIQRMLCFLIISHVTQQLRSPADSMIMSKWVHMSSLTKNLLGSCIGDIFFMIGTFMFAKYLLNRNWRITFASTEIVMVSINIIITLNVVFIPLMRNQYLYVSDDAFSSIFGGMNYLCGLLLAIEISDEGVEGTTYGLITTIGNISQTAGAVIGNIFSFPFSVSKDFRYNRDSITDRIFVGSNITMIYTMQLINLAFISYLPTSKKHTQQLVTSSPTSLSGAVFLILVALALFGFTLIYGFTWPFLGEYFYVETA